MSSGDKAEIGIGDKKLSVPITKKGGPDGDDKQLTPVVQTVAVPPEGLTIVVSATGRVMSAESGGWLGGFAGSSSAYCKIEHTATFDIFYKCENQTITKEGRWLFSPEHSGKVEETDRPRGAGAESPVRQARSDLRIIREMPPQEQLRALFAHQTGEKRLALQSGAYDRSANEIAAYKRHLAGRLGLPISALEG